MNRPVYWECTVGGHSKFWAAQIFELKMVIAPGPNYTMVYKLSRRWGAISTEGQKMEQIYENKYEAETALDKLIWEKEKRGYKPVF